MARAVQAEATVVMPSAARTTAFTSQPVDLLGHRGVQVVYKLTALTGTSVAFNVQIQDPASGDWITVLSSAAETGAGNAKALTVYPGIAVTSNVSASTHPGQRVRVTTTNTAVTSFTATCAVTALP